MTSPSGRGPLRLSYNGITSDFQSDDGGSIPPSRSMVEKLQVPTQAPPHTWAGYSGPWIENAFQKYYAEHGVKTDRIYIPICWTDNYLANGFRAPLWTTLWLNQTLRQDKKYFTVVQNDDGILESIPKWADVLVFAAGGVGNIPIPLLKEDLQPYQRKDIERPIQLCFTGSIMACESARGHAVGKLMTMMRPNWSFSEKLPYESFFKQLNESVFSLCPRGYGRTSFRLYESLGMGAIPVYVWDDIEWLPYKEILDWSGLAVSINVRDIDRLPEILDSHTPEMIAAKQKKIRKLYHHYFTAEAVCEYIFKRLAI